MEMQKEPAPPYVSHHPDELKLPSVPKGGFDARYAHADIKLPDLRTVLSPEFQQASPRQHRQLVGNNITNLHHHHPGYASPVSVRNLSTLEAAHANVARASVDVALASPSETGSFMSVEERRTRSTSVSMDDPDVRIAAEALSGLGKPGYIRSPPSQPQPSSHMFSHAESRASPMQHEPEPLLELLAQAHPWVHGTINGSMSAYNTTKNCSPRFVQYGANLVERNITIPVVSTVSTVGRMTGVESGLRRYLGGNRPSTELDRTEDARQKRRRLTDEEMDLVGDTSSSSLTPTDYRRDSQDSRIEFLPAYRASKPPSYREESSPPARDDRQLNRTPQDHRSWSSQVAGQVFVMTSGLGVALSETSRCSLSFCLTLLSQSTQHVTNVMEALKLVLEQYDRSRSTWNPDDKEDESRSDEKGVRQRPRTPDQNEAARALAEIIKRHSDDIWSTLRNVVTSISNSAGGALPDNARQFVRTQLLSLPQRWRVVSDREVGDSETSRGAHRMIEFAKEGLDMMSQVSQVVKATLDSAERWLERVGRRRAIQGGGGAGQHAPGSARPSSHRTSSSIADKDCEMGDV